MGDCVKKATTIMAMFVSDDPRDHSQQFGWLEGRQGASLVILRAILATSILRLNKNFKVENI